MAESMQPFLPSGIVAKRHYFKTGSLRWVELRICKLERVSNLILSFKPNSSCFGLLIIIINTEDEEALNATIKKC